MVEQATEKTAADALHAELRDRSIFVGQHELVSDVDPAFYASAMGEEDCLVLGLKTASGKATSFYDTGLGRLICNRLVGTLIACGSKLALNWHSQTSAAGCRLLVSARIKIYWMTPEWGMRARDIPPETQFMLVRMTPDGPYAALLPLIDSSKFRATLRPPRFPPPLC